MTISFGLWHGASFKLMWQLSRTPTVFIHFQGDDQLKLAFQSSSSNKQILFIFFNASLKDIQYFIFIFILLFGFVSSVEYSCFWSSCLSWDNVWRSHSTFDLYSYVNRCNEKWIHPHIWSTGHTSQQTDLCQLFSFCQTSDSD